MEVAWKFVRSGALTLSAIADSDFPALDALMRRYRDRPMDFADAALVHVAERERIRRIFTIDNRDFAVYRLYGRSRFTIIPEL